MRHLLCLFLLAILIPSSLQLIPPPRNLTTENPETTEGGDDSTQPGFSSVETTVVRDSEATTRVVDETTTATRKVEETTTVKRTTAQQKTSTVEETTTTKQSTAAEATTTEPSDISYPLPSNITLAEDNNENRRLFWGLWRLPEWRFSIEALIHEGHHLVFSVVNDHCLYNDRATNKEHLKAYCVGL